MDATYLDFNASTPFPAELSDELSSVLFSSFGNPSSLHIAGRKSRKLINESTEAVATCLGEDSAFVYWTSGASEGNSWILHSAAFRAKETAQELRFLVSAIEHESTLLAAKFLAQNLGAAIDYLPVLANGTVDLEALSNKLSSRKYALVSVMHANNETGVIQPINEVVTLCAERQVPLHIDCVQTFLKIPFNIKNCGTQFLTFSGHKIGAPKGVGFVVVRGEGKLLYPLIHGKQQKSLRGGTENAFAVALVGKIIQAYSTGKIKGFEHLRELHEKFEHALCKEIPGTVVHGRSALRLPNTSYVGFEGVEGDSLLMSLDLEGICASSGSACSSGSLDPSHVLTAMACSESLARSSVRFSSGPSTTWTDFERVLKVLPEIVARTR